MTLQIDDVLQAAEDDPTTQKVGWRWRAWANRWERDGLPRPDTIGLLRAEVDQHGGIRRQFVFDRGADILEQFIAAMAWGFGRHPRAPGRLAAMLRPGETAVHLILGEVAAGARSDVGGAYSALFEGGKGRIPGLATAFGTKVIYFNGYMTDVRPRPLIYDQFVWRALTEIGDAPTVPHPQRRVTATMYRAYCEWAEEVADARSIEPHGIEYALFQGGRRLQAT